MDNFQFLQSVMFEMCSAAAQGAAYSSWSSEFARKEVREVWRDEQAPMRKARNRKVTSADLASFTEEQLIALGFGKFGALHLIPLWLWNYVKDGVTLQCIDGSYVLKSAECDLDVRAGCTAYGIFRF